MRHRIPRVQTVLCGLAVALMVAGARPSLAQNGGPPDEMGGPPGGPPPGDMQQQPNRGPSVGRELKQLTRLLTLTTDQQGQMKTILEDQHQQIDTLFKQTRQAEQGGKSSSDATAGDNGPNSEAMQKMRAAVDVIHKDSNAKIAAILTDAQRAKFTAWEEKREKETAQHGDEDMPPPPPDGEGPPDGGGPPGA